jgi:hypothetical protein
MEENDYLIAYEHSSYGYYTTEIEATTMLKALQYFVDNHPYGENIIYSVTLVNSK